MNDLWQRIDLFLELRSVNTARTYRSVIDEWCTFLNVEAGTSKASKAVINATDLEAARYRKWLQDRPGQAARGGGKGSRKQSNSTIHKKFAALRRLYRALIAADIGVTRNPFDVDRVPPPPKDSGLKRPTEMVDYHLIMEIIKAPDTTTRKGLRDAALLACLFGGGLRRSEAQRLTIGDVRITRKGTTFLRLQATKSGKDAEQALPAWAAEVTRSLLTQRKRDGAKADDPLFPSYRGKNGNALVNKPVSTSGIYLLFKKYVTMVGGSNLTSPHSARATAITRLLDKGFTHRDVKAFSRHSSIQMVELYDKRRLSVDESPALDLDF